ncbi:SRPBCC family protein [Xanthobacter autotrophicus DSM 431]|uniref:SRPBCC family protein n=1 Tax=Xanthobacter nonsaccharivorans TaxID=3119912 RepID=UPI00372CCBA3
MTEPATALAAETRELVLTRLIDAPPAKVYRAWTEPELLKQWFAPLPYTVPFAELDVRPGGVFHTVIRSPDGADFGGRGVYLDVVPGEKLVFTDVYEPGWHPVEKPFMTAIVTFEDEGGKTRYTARARHFTVEDRLRHEEMGFHEGWGKATDQLEALAKTL